MGVAGAGVNAPANIREMERKIMIVLVRVPLSKGGFKKFKVPLNKGGLRGLFIFTMCLIYRKELARVH